MATIKAVSSRASIGRAIDYVTKNEKAETAELTGSGKAPVQEAEYQHSRRAYAR